MLMGVVLTLVIVIAAFCAFVATRPADFRIERSASMASPPDVVFPFINDLHDFQQWSPWAERDPNMSMDFEGPSAGEGATVRWSGNREVGQGSMRVTDSRDGELVRYQLEFLKPFKATNTAEFSLRHDGTRTTVTWSMSGRNNFMAKLAGVFMNMDAMVGKDFEQGLAKLKSLVESPTSS